jgi:hypothetical protein
MPRNASPPRLQLFGPDSKHGARTKTGFSDYVWYILANENGRKVERSTRLGISQHAEAQRELTDYISSRRKISRKSDIGTYLVTDALAVYGEQHALAKPGAHNYKTAIKALVPFFEGKTVAPALVQDYKAYRNQKGREKRGRDYTDSAIRRELRELRSALSYCRRQNIIDELPVFDLPPESAPRETWLTRNEAARLLWAALGFELDANGRLARREGKLVRVATYARAPHLPLFIAIAQRTAARKEAILGLRLQPNREGGHVDFERDLIDFRKSGTAQTKKRRAVQPMANKLKALLRAAKRKNMRYVFGNAAGNRIGNIRKSFESAFHRAGLPVGVVPHTLSHTAVTWRVQDDRTGVEAIRIAQFTAKSLDVIMQVYAHHNPAGLKPLQAQR